MRTHCVVLVASALAWGGRASAQPVPGITEWPCVQGSAARSGARPYALTLEPVRWTLSHLPGGEAISFIGPSAPVGAEGRIYVLARVGGAARVLCVDASDGSVVWVRPAPSIVLDSWASPAIDLESGVLVVGAGTRMLGYRLDDGEEAWELVLPAPVVNASPAITGDRGKRRAFVTDYGGFGSVSRLWCINLSPREGSRNPFDPGEAVWSVEIGSASGSSPAAAGGVVVVATTGLDGVGIGELLAFDAAAEEPPVERWRRANPEWHGFYGGVTLAYRPEGLAAYAGSYAFSGGVLSANLVKVRADDGALMWSVPSNRTSSTPVVLDDGRVVLSGGLWGFGTVPSVQCYVDHGLSASLVWDSALDSWVDANLNGRLDAGEFMVAGGWTHHPLVTGSGGHARLLSGRMGQGSTTGAAYTHLVVLDLGVTPDAAGFATIFEGGGGPCAVLGRGVYTIGPEGLTARGPGPGEPDVNGDGRRDVEDLISWHRGEGSLDVDRSGAVNAGDVELLEFELRRNERFELRRR
ncbi:MAG: PQQ-binding-like beta-propeller repeat protein [Phycisphaeraceae bacterium]|nr:PQQ-binding-like beta-propeller repeat protein [Phycisphaeraceae bacterium]